MIFNMVSQLVFIVRFPLPWAPTATQAHGCPLMFGVKI